MIRYPLKLLRYDYKFFHSLIKMDRNTIICLVAVIILVIAIIYIFMDTSGYCNCTGMDTKVNSPPLNLWNAANGGMDTKMMEYIGPDAYGKILSAYDPGMWGVIERDVATRASNRGCNYTSTMPSPISSANKIVPLSSIGASVPPGSVSNDIANYPINAGYIRNGYDTSPNTIPGTSYRYGTYFNECNPDMKVGVM